jgi:peroxiredoxin
LRTVQERIREAGAEIIVVGSGTPQQAGHFIEDHCAHMPVYADPSTSVYDALNATRGAWSTFKPSALKAGIRAFRAGFRQTKRQGSPLQQGGVFVIMPDGSIPYAYRSTAAGDHPAPVAVAEAVEQATARARDR